MEYGTDILLAGTMGDIGPAVRCALEARGLDVKEMAFKQNLFHDEWGYRRALTKAVDSCTPRVIMPVGHPLALARFKDRLPEGVKAAVEDETRIRILDSKVASSALASRLGIRQPSMYASVEQAYAAGDPGQLVFKRDVSFGGHGVHLPWNRTSLANLIAHQPAGEPYLIEEYIEGGDYSVDAIRWGSFFMAASYRTIEKQGMGPAISRESVICPEIEAAARSMLDELDYNGICGMDFRRDGGGKFYFLECNPRFTGGIGTQIASGFDIPYLLWQAVTGETISAGPVR